MRTVPAAVKHMFNSERCRDMAKSFIISLVLLCHDMTICRDMGYNSNLSLHEKVTQCASI